MEQSPVRVLLVDDSPVVLALLKKMLSASPEIQIVGTAQNGVEALNLIPGLKPEVVCTDLYMPRMDGLSLTREIMNHFPLPILVLSASVQEDDSNNIFNLLEAGALEILPKPRGGAESVYHDIAQDLVAKIKLISGVPVIRRSRKSPGVVDPAKSVFRILEKPERIHIVTIGASTGGPKALGEILPSLPVGFPVPVICVQHISEWFLEGMVEWLASKCKVRVQIAKPGERPRAGSVYFPAADTHLELDGEGRFIASSEAPYNGHRPSINRTFTSAAKYFGNRAMGILLTGMGDDGVEGMRNIFNAGGTTIAQDRESCVIFGMPMRAIEAGVAKHILSLGDIGNILSTQSISRGDRSL